VTVRALVKVTAMIAVSLCRYDTVKRNMMKAGEVGELELPWFFFCCGCCCVSHGGSLWRLTPPSCPSVAVQVLSDGTKRRTFANTRECISYLYAQFGLKGFYRGCLANTYRATGGALAMALFDTFQDILKVQ
jgi:hypothetical protein